MYLLDTNVISELRKSQSKRADPNVTAWAQGLDQETFFLSTITIHELEIGTLLKERRDPIQGAIFREWLEMQVLLAFMGRILPIDTQISLQAARLHVPDPRPLQDAMIAATALVHGMTVVTRNVSDFARTGVRLLNPWEPVSYSL